MKNKFNRMAAGGILAAMAFLGSASLAAPAHADVIIDTTKATTLTVFKYLGAPTGQPANGLPQTVNLPTLGGVAFDVYAVYTDSARTQQLNLDTNTSWEAGAKLTGHKMTYAEIKAGQFVEGGVTYYLQATPTTVTTDATGKAVFTGTAALYVVSENLSKSTNIAQAGKSIPANQITPSEPFLVTLPMTDPVALNTWNYNPVVYPKNQQDTATKSVVDSKVTAANNTGGSHVVTWTVKTTITDGLDGPTMGTYTIYDKLDTRVTTSAGNVTVAAGASTLTPTTDYTLTIASGLVTVKMTASGLSKLAAASTADPSAVVTTTIKGTVNNEAGTGLPTGVIPNTASFVPNAAWLVQNPGNDPTTGQPGIPTNTVLTLLGDVVANKVDAVTPATKLAGAEFKLYFDNGDNKCDAADLTGTVISTQVTDATGVATFKGLQVSDFYNGAAQTTKQGYCLVETKAPVGYNLSAQARYVEVLSAGSVTGPFVTSVIVPNEKSNFGALLPLTGGDGWKGAGLAAGGLIVAGGVGALALGRRGRQDDQA